MLRIHIPFGGGARRWKLDVSAPPVEATQTGSRFGALFLIVFALVWGGFPSVGLLSLLRQGQTGPEALLFLLFPLIAAGLILYGVQRLLWRRTVAFDGTTFSVTERGLRGVKRWREPLTAFQGVMRHKRRVRTKNRSYTLYMVDLQHRDDERTINLYTDTSDRGFREIWEDYARRLRLPAFEEGDAGMVRREAGDLDKTVSQLIGEGKVDVDYEALTRRARGLAVSFEGDTVVITRTGPQNSWWGSLIAVLFPLLFVGAGFFAPDLPLAGRIVFAGVGMLFEILFVIGVVQDLTTRRRLRVGPDGVRVNRVGGRGETEGKRMPLDAIESVSMARTGRGRRPAVIMAGDAASLDFGAGLPRPSLDFVLNTILAKIAESARRRR